MISKRLPGRPSISLKEADELNFFKFLLSYFEFQPWFQIAALFLALILPFSPKGLQVLSLITAGCFIVVIPFCRDHRNGWIHCWLIFVLFIIASWTSGWPLFWDNRRGVNLNMPSCSITGLSGVCSGDSSFLASGGCLFILADPLCIDSYGNRTKSTGGVSVLLNDTRQLFSGQELRVIGAFLEPDSADGAGEAHLTKRLFIADKVKLTSRWSSRIMQFRGYMLDRTDYRFFSKLGSAGGFLKALLLGVRDDLSGQLYMDFRKAGVMHILALSGMHLGILVGAFTFVLLPLTGRRLTFPLIGVFLFCYLFITGWKVSLIRAALMFLVSGAAVYSGRECSHLRSLGWALFLSLLLFPSQVSSPGFQLSFFALGGIILLGLPLSRRLSQRLPAVLAMPFGISLGAQIATLPILLYHFHEFIPSGLVCSLVLSPLITVFIWIGLALMPLFIIIDNFTPGCFSFCPDFLYTLIEKAVRFFTSFPVFSFSEKAGRGAGKTILLLLVLGGISGMIRRGWFEYKLRFSPGDSAGAGDSGTFHDKAVWSELSNQSTGQTEAGQSAGS